MAAAAAAATTQLPLAEVRGLCVAALTKCGLNPAAADAIADVVHCAERDGCSSHGLFRLPGYCAALTAGKVRPLGTCGRQPAPACSMMTPCTG